MIRPLNTPLPIIGGSWLSDGIAAFGECLPQIVAEHLASRTGIPWILFVHEVISNPRATRRVRFRHDIRASIWNFPAEITGTILPCPPGRD